MANELIEQLNAARAALKARRDALADEVAEIDLALGTTGTLRVQPVKHKTYSMAKRGLGPTHERVLEYLRANGGQTVNAIAQALEITTDLTYVHLGRLYASGLIAKDQSQSPRIYSALPTPETVTSNGVAAQT